MSIANIRIFSRSNVINNINNNKLSFKFSKLKGLMARTSDPIIYKQILSKQSNQLQSFHLERDQWESYEVNDKIRNYDNLQELCIANMSGDTFKHIIKNTNNLKRFHWRLDYDKTTQQQEYNEIMNIILKQHRNLEYFAIEYSNNIEAVVEPIHNILTHDVNGRYNLKFKIVLISMKDLNFVIDHLDKILKSMTDAVCNDFMVILDISDSFRVLYEDFEIICLKYNNNKYLCRLITHSFNNIDDEKCIIRFVIYNKNNKMCGFNERWIMKCPKCCNIVDHGI